MSAPIEGLPNIKMPHSAEYFGDQRDFWWNPEFVALMAARWKLSEARFILDAGCGVGHWGRVLAPFLSPEATVVGIDREAQWVRKAAEIAKDKDLHRFGYRQGDVNALPFADESFDLVTCQTVLIHVPDPRATLREFVRVLKPGGLLALSEPNNLAASLVRDSGNFDGAVDLLLSAARLQAICERGKAALGLGNNSVGDLLPGYLHELGLNDLQVCLSDKATLTVPNQSDPGQAADLAQTEDWLKRDFWIWEKGETRSYYLAGGGTPDLFAELWEIAMDRRRQSFLAAKAGRLSAIGAGLQYLISGRKPR
ncbi:MAG: methyltransferase domain-containing protein [Elusimicrobia bacterium]|nr:methyltransferase domain-containing protein [Elusimicrobiota bacterium]